MGSPIPPWLRQMLLAEDAMQFAPRPSVNEIVARMNLPRPKSTEDFLRQLREETGLAERLAVRATHDAYSPEANIFGAPVKTIEQGRARGERNLPGIDNLPLEDQALLREKLDQAAMLRAMTGVSEDPRVRYINRGGVLPHVRVTPADRAQDFTGAGTPFLGGTDLPMSGAMSLLQNRRDYARLTGLSPDFRSPPALRHNFQGELVPSVTAEALGDDVANLVGTIHNDKTKSRLLQLEEMQQQQLFDEMAQSADEVAAQEARAREYGGLPPETLAQMDKSNRSHLATMRRQTEAFDPRANWARQMGGNMDPQVGSPLYPPSQLHAFGNYPTSNDYFWATQGKNIVKGAALGHILSYPLIYAAYQMMKPGETAPGKTTDIPPEEDLASFQADRERAIAESQRAYEAEQTRSFMDDLPDVPVDMNATQYRRGAMPSMPDVPIDLPEMPFVSMPQDSVGIPDDPMEDMMLMEEGVAGAPAMDELDAAMLESGLQPAATSRQDISSMEVDGRRVDSLYPPESLEYQMEQEYKRRARRNPYPALSY